MDTCHIAYAHHTVMVTLNKQRSQLHGGY